MSRILLYLSFVLQCYTNECNPRLIVQDAFAADKRTFSLMEEKFFLLSLIENQVYVDKSLFIKDIIEDENKTYMITCPRRWGKSINMDMIKIFFEMEVDSFGNPVPLAETPSYRLFVNGEVTVNGRTKKLQNPLLIAEHQRIIDEYLGKWPVIYISLYETMKANFTNMVPKIGHCISKAFLRHQYVTRMLRDIIADDKSDKNAKADAQERLNLFEYYCSPNKTIKWNRGKLENSLFFLSQMLHEYFKKGVFVLLDDYFTPWEMILPEKNIAKYDREKFNQFYWNLLSKTFKKNPYLEKGIIMGIYPMCKELRESALSNVIECNLISGKFMEYFGFTQWESESLYHHLNITNDTAKKLSKWYNGFKVNNRDIHIHNPWSMISYFNTKTFDTFWIHTGCMRSFIENCFEVNVFKTEFQILLQGGDTMIERERQYFTIEEYEEITKIWVHTYDAPIQEHHCTEKLFMFFHIHGYLTLSEDTTPNFMYYRMKFPNEEIKSTMKWKWDIYIDNPPITRRIRRMSDRRYNYAL